LQGTKEGLRQYRRKESKGVDFSKEDLKKFKERLKGVHLVGSVPLKETREVFYKVCSVLGENLRRIPDGETGLRKNWIMFQVPFLLKSGYFVFKHPFPKVVSFFHQIFIVLIEKEWFRAFAKHFEARTKKGDFKNTLPLLRFKDDVFKNYKEDEIILDTKYDYFALKSFEVFRKMKEKGEIASHVKFQVSLPTPYSSMLMFVDPKSHELYFKVYQRALLKALDNILKSIDHKELSIQWDVCQEVLAYEGYFEKGALFYKKSIKEMLSHFGDHIPEQVDIGYHFCYGSPPPSALHIMNPKNMSIMVEMAGDILSTIRRKVDWFHMPVPKDRCDDAYFAPLKNLTLSKETILYLGLIHDNDDKGNYQRVLKAFEYYQSFGLSSECGWGRVEQRRIPNFLTSHAVFF
jgi:hypothetical protein